MVRVGAYGAMYPPFDRCVETAVEAERAGMDWVIFGDQMCFSHPISIWTPDITSTAELLPSFDAFYEPGTLITAAASKTSTIKFLYGPVDVVRRAPNVLAQTLLTLDHATQGRTMMVLANGENKQMKPYGIARKGANDKLWDASYIMRSFLETNGVVDYDGKVWKMRRAKFDLGPYGEQAPPFWLAGGSPANLELAGKVADGWITAAPGHTEDDPQQFIEKVSIIRRHAEGAGRDPETISIGLMIFLVLDDDESKCDELRDHPIIRWNTLAYTPTTATFKKWGLEHPWGYDWIFSRDAMCTWYDKDYVLDACRKIPREAVDKVNFVGTPEQVMTRLSPYMDSGLVTDVMLCNFNGLCGVEYAETSGRALNRLTHMIKGTEMPKDAPAFASLV
jgi:phthiodiolone/phenolphthiodiolone dimycocerosates ketoreductase